MPDRLNHWKEQLLDLTKRNRLLNFKETRGSTLPFHHPTPDLLFDRLARQGKPLTFPGYGTLIGRLTLEQYARAGMSAGAEGPPTGTDPGTGADTGTADPLSLPLEVLAEVLRPGEALARKGDRETQRVLNTLRLRSRASMEEEGVNILFVSFGLLRWQEQGERFLSPLVLVPVQLRRRSVEDPFGLIPLEEESVLNPTLALKLAKDHGVALDELPEDVTEVPLRALLERVTEGVTSKGWSVSDETYLGLFSFQKLAMYRDLEVQEAAARSHPIVRTLLGDTPRVDQASVSVPEPGELDGRLFPEETYEVLPADSTQQVAIRAAVAGQSFILHGPPGTGKSQTIANIIAECLARRKSVLFVAEKMAALDVVYDRLRECQLDPFCLEVHSYKANKRDVIRELGKALSLQLLEDPEAERFSWAHYRQLRERLNGYLTALHTPVTPLGWTPYEVYGRLAALSDAPNRPFTFTGASEVTPEEWERSEGILDLIEANRAVLERYEEHPWHGCQIEGWSLQTQNETGAHLKEAADRLAGLDEAAGELASLCGLDPPQRHSEMEAFLRRVERALGTPHPPAHWFKLGPLTGLTEDARSWNASQRRYEALKEDLSKHYESAVLDLPTEELLERLTSLNAAAIRQLRPLDGTPEDRALREGDRITGALGRVTALAQSLTEGSRELSNIVGQPAPETLGEASDLIELAGGVARDPRPEPDWFERRRLLKLREEARSAGERYEEEGRLEGLLLGRYESDLLEEPLEEILERYESVYGNVLRVLRPAYWRDRGRVTRWRKVDRKGGHAEIVTDLRQAVQLRRTHQWVEENMEAHSLAFGRHFSGRETDWPALLSALDDLLHILDQLPGQQVPGRLRELLLASGNPVRTVRDLWERLRHSHDELHQALSSLETDLAEGHSPRPGSWRSFRLADLGAWSSSLNAGLRDFIGAAEPVSGCVRTGGERGYAEVVAALESVRAIRETEGQVRSSGQYLKDTYGDFFEGLETPWERVIQALAWTGETVQAFGPGEVPEAHIARLSDPAFPPPQVRSLSEEVRDKAKGTEEAVRELGSYFSPSALGPDVTTFLAVGWGQLIDWLGHKLRHLDDLQAWCDFQRAVRPCWEGALRGYIVDLIGTPGPARSAPRDTFLRRFYTVWLDEVARQVPMIGEFRRARAEEDLRVFRSMDRELRRVNEARVRREVMSARPKHGEASRLSEVGVLRTEAGKVRRHKPLRRLFGEIPNLLQTLKPCLMMSPLSVAKFLEPGTHRFDVILFDEASQIGPEDAVGAVLRGDQLIVAGDKRQLPPTRFGSRTVNRADLDEEEGEEEPVMESVLEECERCDLPRHVLRWHYRSLKEALIAFSNQHFYMPFGEGLYTFPAADEGDPETGGVYWEYVPEGLYRPKPHNTNPVEAERVADLVFDHLRNRPGETLGVIALSEAQQLEILNQLDRRRLEDPTLPNPNEEGGEESFFVTNLENVQGHERDAIILCIGYGPTERNEHGRATKVSLNFGPINRAGGERRLNVAVTRAKRRLHLVTSLMPEEIDLKRATSEGARLLREYMLYVRDRLYLRYGDPPEARGGRSQLESSLLRGLRSLPCVTEERRSVDAPVGTSLYPVEVGVTHPDAPHEYGMGVLFDGHVARSVATARDREIIRPSELRKRGWSLHRLWAPECARDLHRELGRMVEALKGGNGGTGDPERGKEAPDGDAVWGEAGADPADEGEGSGLPEGAVPYRETPERVIGPPDDFYRGDLTQVAGRLVEVVRREGPILFTEAARRVAASWGVSRAGSRVLERVREAYDLQRYGGNVLELREGFLWQKGVDRPPVRVPETGGPRRQIEQIALEEIGEAALLVLRMNVGMTRDDLVRVTAKLLGFDHTGGIIFDRVNQAVRALEGSGRVECRDERVRAVGE